MVEDSQQAKASRQRVLSAVTRAFVDNQGYLQAFLRRFLSRQQDIEDVAQEAYLKAYSIEQGKPIEHPRAFLFTIAKNIAINELSRKARQVTDYIEDCTAHAAVEYSANAETELEAKQTLGFQCEAVAALPEQCRRVYLLRRVHGLKQREIADSLGISVRAVQKHLQLGVLKCRQYIDEREQEALGNTDVPRVGVIPLEGRQL